MKRLLLAFFVMFVLTQVARLLPPESKVIVTVILCCFMLVVLAMAYAHLDAMLKEAEQHLEIKSEKE